MLAKQPLHGGALHALAAAMDETHFMKARVACGTQVFLDYRNDISGRETVEVDRIFDWDIDRRLVFHC